MELNNQFRESFEDKVVNSHFFDVGFNLRITDSNGFIHHLTLKMKNPESWFGSGFSMSYFCITSLLNVYEK